MFLLYWIIDSKSSTITVAVDMSRPTEDVEASPKQREERERGKLSYERDVDVRLNWHWKSIQPPHHVSTAT